MNAEELTEKIWNDFNVYRKYNGFIKRYWKEYNIDPDIRPGDMELIAKAKIDFFGVNCYRSNVAKAASVDSEYQNITLNKTGRKGEFVYPNYPGIFAQTVNPYVEMTDWDWEIDPVGMRYLLRYMQDHYHLPMIITENGFGAHESLGEDGQVHDEKRIQFLRDQIYQVGLAIEDGCEVIGYNPWSFTDLLSTGNGMAKRYGLVYINTTDDEVLDLKRTPKDSYYWYARLIKSNGQEWGEETDE